MPRDNVEVHIDEIMSNKKGLPAYNYLEACARKIPDAMKKTVLGPALLTAARAQATAVRKSYVARVGNIKKRVPPRLRSIVYRRNKRRGKLYKSIKAVKGIPQYHPSAVLRIGGYGARQAALVEHGHQGSFGPPRKTSYWNHPQYYKNVRVDGKHFVRAAFVGSDQRVTKAFERKVKREEKKIAKEARVLADRGGVARPSRNLLQS